MLNAAGMRIEREVHLQALGHAKDIPIRISKENSPFPVRACCNFNFLMERLGEVGFVMRFDEAYFEP